MPKKTSSKANCDNCDLCCSPLVEGKEDILHCEGICQLKFHRYCAGISVSHFKRLTSSSSPFVCSACSQTLQEAKVSQLLSEVADLKAQIASLQELLLSANCRCDAHDGGPLSDQHQPGEAGEDQVSEDSQGWSSVVKRNLPPSAPKQRGATKLHGQNHNERKFNVVFYELAECKKGSSRNKRTQHDTSLVSKTIESICSDVPSQSIRDCVRLGKYDESRNRPVLAHLNRTCDVSNVLSNRHKLFTTPGISVKPHQSPKERATESTLLRQRRALIVSGIDKGSIKIRGNSIYVNNQNYGTANASEFLAQATTNASQQVNDNPISSNKEEVVSKHAPKGAIQKTSVSNVAVHNKVPIPSIVSNTNSANQQSTQPTPLSNQDGTTQSL